MLDQDAQTTNAALRLPDPREPSALPFSVPVFLGVYVVLFLTAMLALRAGGSLAAGFEAAAIVIAALIGGHTGAANARDDAASALRAGLRAAGIAALCVALALLSFRRVGFDPISAPFWPALAAAVSVRATRIGRGGVRSLRSADPLAVVMILGILLSAALCDYPWWWQLSISYLGHGVRLYRWVFDATLLACSILLLLRASEVSRHFSILEPLGVTDARHRQLTSGVYRIAAAGMMLVAVFPYGNGRSTVSGWVHNFGAWIAFGILLAAMAATSRLTPFLRADLLRESLVTFSVIAGLFVLYWPGHYLSLAVFEVMSLVLILVWLARWTRALAAIAEECSVRQGASPLRPPVC